MHSRERVYKTLRFAGPDRAPRDLWWLGTVPQRHKADLEAVLARYPRDFAGAPVRRAQSRRAVALQGEVGEYTDDWGSLVRVLEAGVYGEVVRPALPDWRLLEAFTPPFEVLQGMDVSPSRAAYAQTECFVIAGASAMPFQQLFFLRGFEQALVDLAEEPGELHELLSKIHAYYLRELELLAPVAADAISFKDDWGTETALLLSPAKWRRIFKPLYADYCRSIHAAGKRAFFHSDGEISAIYPDLIEIGVDAINSQLFCMDLERLGQQHAGRVTFWGELDRRLLAHGTPAEVRAAVWRVRRALGGVGGGLVAQCEWGNDSPRANIEAVFETWEEP